MHGIAPSFVDSLLSLKQSRYNVRSLSNNTLTRSEIKSAKTTGDRAFVVGAPVLWNALLPSLRAVVLVHSRNNLRRSFLGKHTFRFYIYLWWWWWWWFFSMLSLVSPHFCKACYLIIYINEFRNKIIITIIIIIIIIIMRTIRNWFYRFFIVSVLRTRHKSDRSPNSFLRKWWFTSMARFSCKEKAAIF